MPSSNQTACEADTQQEFIIQAVFLAVILVVTLFGNFMVCLAVVLFRRLRNLTNYFVVSLAVSDMLVALVSLPLRIDQTVHNMTWCLGLEACAMWIATDLLCSSASILNLTVISVDRYIAIVHPFRYHGLMTSRVGTALIAFAWGYSLLWMGLSFMNWTDYGAPQYLTANPQCGKWDPIYYTVVTCTNFYVPLLVVIVMYGFVFRVAMNQARAVAAMQTSSKGRRGRRTSINLVREVKAAKTLAIVVGAFVVCWFPFFTLNLISLYNLPLLQAMDKKVALGVRYTFVYVLPAINSTLNPIIYAMFNREFRSAFAKLFGRIWRSGALARSGADATFASTLDDGHSMRAVRNGNDKEKKIRFTSYDPSEQDSTEPEARSWAGLRWNFICMVLSFGSGI